MLFDDERTGEQIGQHRSGIGNHRQQRDAESVLEQQRGFAQPFGPRRRDKFRLGGIQHAFAHEPGNFAGEEQTKRDDRQDHVPRRFPQRDRRRCEFDGAGQNQNGCDDKTGNAHREDGEKAAHVILPMPAPRRRENPTGRPMAMARQNDNPPRVIETGRL